MKSDAIDPDAGTAADDVFPTTIFRALGHERRLRVIEYLVTRPGDVALEDLVEYVAVQDGEPTSDALAAIRTDLRHAQLPHLVDAGLVGLDGDSATAQLAVGADTLRPYLELAGTRPTE